MDRKIEVTAVVPPQCFRATFEDFVEMGAEGEREMSNIVYFRAFDLEDAKGQAARLAAEHYKTTLQEVTEIEEIPPDGYYFPTINERAAMMFLEMFQE